MSVRLEVMAGRLDDRRKAEIDEFLCAQARVLAQLATCGTRLGDEARPCILNVFLTLINVCERVARVAQPESDQTPLSRVPPRLAVQSASALK